MNFDGKARGILVAIVLAHVALAMVYATVTPYRTAGILRLQGGSPAPDIGAPDERQHANYVQRLLDGRGFPVFDPEDPNLYESYQSHQPPLYYVLAAGWSKLAGVSDVDDPAAGTRLRALSALLGAASVAGVFFLGLWGTRRVEVGLLAAAIASWLPMLGALDGAIGNDPLLIALCTWSLALLALGAREGWTARRCAVLAALCGAAFLTKTSALALVFPLIVVLAAPLTTRNPRAICATLAGAVLLALPWWIRNQQLYGDPLAMRAFGEAFGGTAQARDFIAQFGALSYWLDWVGWWTARSFVGAFGYMDIFLPDTLYRLWLALWVAAFAGWLLWTRNETDGPTRVVRGANLVFAIVVLALFLRFNAQYFQGQGRYLMHAVGPFAVGVAAGILHLGGRRGALAGWLVCAGMLATNLYALSTLPREFSRRTALPPVSANREHGVARTVARLARGVWIGSESGILGARWRVPMQGAKPSEPAGAWSLRGAGRNRR